MSKKQKRLLAAQAAEALAAEYAAAAAPYDPQPEDFGWVGSDASSREAIARPSTSFWQDGMRRLFKTRLPFFALLCCRLLFYRQFLCQFSAPSPIPSSM